MSLLEPGPLSVSHCCLLLTPPPQPAQPIHPTPTALGPECTLNPFTSLGLHCPRPGSSKPPSSLAWAAARAHTCFPRVGHISPPCGPRARTVEASQARQGGGASGAILRVFSLSSPGAGTRDLLCYCVCLFVLKISHENLRIKPGETPPPACLSPTARGGNPRPFPPRLWGLSPGGPPPRSPHSRDLALLQIVDTSNSFWNILQLTLHTDTQFS